MIDPLVISFQERQLLLDSRSRRDGESLNSQVTLEETFKSRGEVLKAFKDYQTKEYVDR